MLDRSSLVREPAVRSGWLLSVSPEAGEAGGCFVPRRKRPSSGGGIPNPERSRQEAARRARGRLRRYCAANRLNRLGTLTYAPPFCTDPSQVRRDVGVFFRELRDATGGEPFPYIWVPEFHADGSRFHLHFAVGRFIKRSLIEDSWGHGYVSIKLLGDLPVGSGRLAEARRAAQYLGKYVSKSFEDTRIPRRHRYDVAQGFQPKRVQVWGSSAVEVIEEASAMFGGALPDHMWRSSDAEDWQGPPAVWVRARIESLRATAEEAERLAEGSDPESIAALVADAREAWDAGQNFYLPIIRAAARAIDDGVLRARGAEMALDVITAQGWRLHTWVWSDAGSMGTLSARPLFVRPGS